MIHAVFCFVPPGFGHPSCPFKFGAKQVFCFVDACLTGLGWGLNPEPLVAEHLAAGRLVELVPNAAYDVALHWQFARLTAGAIRPLTRAMRAAAAQMLRIQ